MKKFLLNKTEKIILLGNEAIVRGAIEAGVQFVSTYPGTPASEVGNTFSIVAKKLGIYFEDSTNEKVALEAGIGASFSGLRTLIAMKSFGVNVCSDSLMPFLYMGSKGPTVIVEGDDPNCWSSAQSEQDSRAYAYLAHIPVLEPSDAQECKDFTKLAFQLSQKFKIPFMIRTTTRVSHQRMPVKISPFKKSSFKGKFVKDPKRFITMPPRVLEMKKELLGKIEEIKKISENNKISPIIQRGERDNKVGIITAGVPYLYVREALNNLGLNIPVLKLGFFYPLPEEKIKNFIKNLKKVLIVEELESYIEKEVAILAKEVNPSLKVSGKNYLSVVGELKPDDIAFAIAKVTGNQRLIKPYRSIKLGKIPKRLPQLCPGCYYRLVFRAVKKIAPKNTIFGGDIGCYMMAGLSPFFLQDYLSCMGSSVGIAHGINKASKSKVIAFIGDSTFFHAGIPALINTVFNKSNPLIIVMNNETTAMTGHQTHPGVGKTGMGAETQAIKIENIVKACGVKYLKVIDPVNIREMEKTIKEFLKKKEVSVIVSRRLCWLLSRRFLTKKKK